MRDASPADLNGLIDERMLGNGPQNSINAQTAALVNELRVWKEKVARLEQQKERDEAARKSQMAQIVKMKEQNRKAMGEIESGLKRRQLKAQRSTSPQVRESLTAQKEDSISNNEYSETGTPPTKQSQHTSPKRVSKSIQKVGFI